MFYIFHGEDTHSQKETLAKLMAKMGDPAMLDLNTKRLSPPITMNDLHQACDAVPFLAKVRLAIVSDWLTSKQKPDKEIIKALKAYLPQLPQTTRLIFLESRTLPQNHALLKLAQTEERGYVKQFSRPEGRALERWLAGRVEQKNGRISPHAIHLLVANIGNDLQVLDNEIEKLVLYKGEEETIESKDVQLMCPYVAEANIFDLVDALGNRNGKKAALLLQQKYSEGVDPFYLFSMFIRQFRLLIQVKELADAGQRPPNISKELKLHSFVVGKLYQQARGFSLPQLEQIYRHLLDIDVGVKIGRQDMPTALNLLIATLSTS